MNFFCDTFMIGSNIKLKTVWHTRVYSYLVITLHLIIFFFNSNNTGDLELYFSSLHGHQYWIVAIFSPSIFAIMINFAIMVLLNMGRTFAVIYYWKNLNWRVVDHPWKWSWKLHLINMSNIIKMNSEIKRFSELIFMFLESVENEDIYRRSP